MENLENVLAEIAVTTYELKDYLVQYNPHPKGLSVGDCVKRAFTKLLDKDYKVVARELNRSKDTLGFHKFNSSGNVFAFARLNDFTKYDFKKYLPKGKFTLTCKEFALTHKTGRYLLSVHRHVVACVDGKLYDSWNSGDKHLLEVFVKKEYAIAKSAEKQVADTNTATQDATPAVSVKTDAKTDFRPAYEISPYWENKIAERGWIKITSHSAYADLSKVSVNDEQTLYNDLIKSYAKVKLYRLSKDKSLVAYVKGGK